MAAGVLFVASFSLGCNPTQTSEVKIRNGEDVGAGEAGPYLRSVASLAGGCTSTIIAPDLLLTAAHCENAIQAGVAIFGNYFKNGQQIRIESYKVHGAYGGNANNQRVDVAVVKLSQNIPEGYYAVPLFNGQLNQGEGVVLTGYGTTGSTKEAADGKLRKTSAQFVGEDNGALFVKGNNTGVCSGDSGGPLFVFRDNKTFVAGAASTSQTNGDQCVDGSHYSSTTALRDVILQFARELTGRSDPLGDGGGSNGGGGGGNDAGGGSGWGSKVQFKSVLNQQCIDVAGQSQAANADILSWDCTGHNNQKFRMKYFNSTDFVLINHHSGLCIDVGAWSQEEGARVNTWNCDQNQGNQVFSFTANENGSVQFRNKHSGKCLTIAGGNAEAGTRIVMSGCENRTEQQFWIEE